MSDERDMLDADAERDIERLRAFADDPANPEAKRSQAREVIDIYTRRMRELNDRTMLTVSVTPLGILLLLPAAPETPCPGWCGKPAGDGGRLCPQCFTRFNSTTSHPIACGCEDCRWAAITVKCIRGDWRADTAERIRREASA